MCIVLVLNSVRFTRNSDKRFCLFELYRGKWPLPFAIFREFFSYLNILLNIFPSFCLFCFVFFPVFVFFCLSFFYNFVFSFYSLVFVCLFVFLISFFYHLLVVVSKPLNTTFTLTPCKFCLSSDYYLWLINSNCLRLPWIYNNVVDSLFFFVNQHSSPSLD